MWKAFAVGAAAVVLSGCAAMNHLNSDVSTFSQWPADRKPGSYVFERLPSQQQRAEQQQVLEDAARRGLEQAGFTPAADSKEADVTVTLGARVNASDPWPFADPFWWHGGLFYSRRHPFWGPGWGPGWGGSFYDTPRYEREVALLIRDRKTGQPLYEARASNDGTTSAINALLPAMFAAAMKDFPAGGTNPRVVTTQITP